MTISKKIEQQVAELTTAYRGLKRQHDALRSAFLTLASEVESDRVSSTAVQRIGAAVVDEISVRGLLHGGDRK